MNIYDTKYMIANNTLEIFYLRLSFVNTKLFSVRLTKNRILFKQERQKTTKAWRRNQIPEILPHGEI